MGDTLYEKSHEIGFCVMCDNCRRVCVRPDLDFCQACKCVRLLLIVPALRHCRGCGCHEERTPPPPIPGHQTPYPGETCSWAAPDLCSRCAAGMVGIAEAAAERGDA